MNEKLCPMSFYGTDYDRCVEKKCQWWMEKRCVIEIIPIAIDRLTRQLKKEKDNDNT